MKKKYNLKELLNLELLDYTNLTPKVGDLDMPFVACSAPLEVDYLATYSQPSTYFITDKTCVSFFEYDVKFDGITGLWNAIYYGIEELQNEFLERFQGIKLFIAPDYSKCGDCSEIENMHRQFRARIVSIWLSINLRAIVIPLVSSANSNGFDYMLDGMEDCSTVAFNAKGPMGCKEQLPIFINSIKFTVDNLKNLNSIIVYSSSPDQQRVFEIFEYAIANGIKVQIPNNTLQERNRLQGVDCYGSSI